MPKDVLFAINNRANRPCASERRIARAFDDDVAKRTGSKRNFRNRLQVSQTTSQPTREHNRMSTTTRCEAVEKKTGAKLHTCKPVDQSGNNASSQTTLQRSLHRKDGGRSE